MTDRRSGAPDHLHVRADLQITVDGVDAHLSGDGQNLRLETDRPLALLRRAAASGSAVPGRRLRLVEAVDAASDRGLTVVATGRRGPTIRVGADVSSATARRLLGTPHLQLVVSRSQRLWLGAGALSGLAALVWALERRSGHRGS